MDNYLDRCYETINEVLKESIFSIEINEVSSTDYMDGSCEATVKYNEVSKVSSKGVGLFDAILNSFKNKYIEDYLSLNYISIEDFQVSLKPKSGFNSYGSDKICKVSVTVKNHNGSRLTMIDNSTSLLASVAKISAKIVSFFINSERCFLFLHRALEDAKQRNRPDLVDKYTRQMSDIVVVADYSHILEK